MSTTFIRAILATLATLVVGLIWSVAPEANAAAFAKYDGIDGESNDANHSTWIDVLKVEWGVARPTAGATGQSRRRGTVIVEDMRLTMEYDKASVKLQEKCVMGEVIPKLEIEMTATYGGARATYLKYEMVNVRCATYHVETVDDLEQVPMVVLSHNFEEIKVTYTEFDSEGNVLGKAETEASVGRRGRAGGGSGN